VGNYTYLWQPGNIVNNGSLNVLPANNITYTVTATDANNCAGIPATASILVYSFTAPNVQMSPTSFICPSHSAIISSTVAGLTGPLTYLWNPPVGNGAGPFTVSPLQATTYYVTITNNCNASVLDSTKVLFNPPPTIIIKPDTNALCFHETFMFNDNSVSANSNDPINTWLWNFGDNTTSTVQNPTHTYSNSGIYSVRLTVTTAGGCTNNNILSPFEINTFPYPIAAFSVNQSSFEIPFENLICNNSSQSASRYHWDFGDGTESTVKSPTHLYNTAGAFRIQLVAISPNGCTDTTFTYITTTAKIVFPNAFTPDKKFASGGTYDSKSYENDVFFPYTAGVVEFDFEIFNRWGELIFVSKDINIGWDGYYRGKLCEQDVYIWRAAGKFNDGKTFRLKGDVTLLR
jgi:PKD repeat protein